MEKAIQTTNLWLSYKDDINKREKVRAELDEWKGATIIRVLASTATNHRPNHVANLLNKERNPRTEGRDLFLLCNKKDTEDLFGKPFARLIDARKPSADPEERNAVRRDNQSPEHQKKTARESFS